LWYATGLKESDIKIPIMMYADNTAAIDLCRNPVLSDRSRHIDISYHFVRESVMNKRFDLDYINTASNPADLFTKALVPVTHDKFCTVIGLAAERECWNMTSATPLCCVTSVSLISFLFQICFPCLLFTRSALSVILAQPCFHML